MAAAAAAVANALMGIGMVAKKRSGKAASVTTKVLRVLRNGGSLASARKVNAQRKKGKNRRRNETQETMNTKPQSNLRRVSAPVSYGNVYTSKTRNHRNVVPFNSISLANVCTTGSSGVAAFNGTNASTLTYFFDLAPVTNDVGGLQNAPFGTAIAKIASSYARYRLRSLRLTYVPIVPTSFGGSVIIGATMENWLSNAPTVQNVADCEISLTTPTWSTASMDLTPLLRRSTEWNYVYSVASGGAAEQRMEYAISLLISGIGAGGTVNSALGYLRFEGEIEFMSLSEIAGNLNASSSSSHPSGSGKSQPEPESPLIVEEPPPIPKRPTSSSSARSGWMG